MNRFIFSAFAGGALTALAVSFPAGAQAAPAGVGSAQDTVDSLESSGYHVVLNKLGHRPLAECTVDSVQPGETVTRPAASSEPTTREIVYRTVYLTAKC